MSVYFILYGPSTTLVEDLNWYNNDVIVTPPNNLSKTQIIYRTINTKTGC